MNSFSESYLDRLQECLESIDRPSIDSAIELIRTTWTNGGQIISLGNGGSAMTALHYMTDWTKMIYLATGRQFRGRSLVDNMGLLTAYANDTSYADVFSEQLKAVASPGDLVIAISGSGNSPNVIRAIEMAHSLGCETLGLCGFNGGRLRELAKNVVWVNVQDMQLSEDVHAIFGHMVMKALCNTE
jgi:D-sedoheptulose 7-phosphate isomerase